MIDSFLRIVYEKVYKKMFYEKMFSINSLRKEYFVEKHFKSLGKC